MPRRTLATSPARIASRERQAQAVQLRKQGFSYEQIAASLGYGSKASAYKAVRTALDEVVRESAYDMVALETERLHFMLSRIWPEVEKGNLLAIDRALMILDREAKLYGLYSLPPERERGLLGKKPSTSAQTNGSTNGFPTFYEALRALVERPSDA